MKWEKRSLLKSKGEEIYGCNKEAFLEDLAVTWLDMISMLL
jgi:hypothetical protein